jgi:hypothetical protein
MSMEDQTINFKRLETNKNPNSYISKKSEAYLDAIQLDQQNFSLKNQAELSYKIFLRDETKDDSKLARLYNVKKFISEGKIMKAKFETLEFSESEYKPYVLDGISDALKKGHIEGGLAAATAFKVTESEVMPYALKNVEHMLFEKHDPRRASLIAASFNLKKPELEKLKDVVLGNVENLIEDGDIAWTKYTLAAFHITELEAKPYIQNGVNKLVENHSDFLNASKAVHQFHLNDRSSSKYD